MQERIGHLISNSVNLKTNADLLIKRLSFWPICTFRVRHETAEEDQRTYRPKRYVYNNEVEDKSPNILRDKDYQASSKKC